MGFSLYHFPKFFKSIFTTTGYKNLLYFLHKVCIKHIIKVIFLLKICNITTKQQKKHLPIMEDAFETAFFIDEHNRKSPDSIRRMS